MDKYAGVALDQILIVEPDLELAQQIKVALERLGNYEAQLTDNAEDALALIKAGNYQIVLTDSKLGKYTGFELAFEIRKDRITKPEIILLSNDPQDSVFEAHQIGVGHILQKPINIDELSAIMNRYAQESRRYERIQVVPTQHGSLLGDITVPATNQRNCDLEISNIGRGGFFYRVGHESELPEIGQIIDFQLKLGMLPDHNFSGRGIVRWMKRTQGEIGVGIEFLVIPEDSERLISAFVDLFKIRQFVPSES